MTNPHYVRPSATAKGQPGDVRTPLSDDSPMQSVQKNIPGDSQNEVRDADSTTALFSSLCSPVIPTPSENGQEVCLSDTNRTPGDDGTESPKEAQDGTIGGETYPNTGKRI